MSSIHIFQMGEIAQVNAIYSTEKSVHIPDTIDGAGYK